MKKATELRRLFVPRFGRAKCGEKKTEAIRYKIVE